MKITAQLALSQMKVNKKRTIAGIFAIALATSLITTVMCFVTSTNKMLSLIYPFGRLSRYCIIFRGRHYLVVYLF